jgi:hypothetical protein
MNHCQNGCAKDGHIRDWISSSNELNASQKRADAFIIGQEMITFLRSTKNCSFIIPKTKGLVEVRNVRQNRRGTPGGRVKLRSPDASTLKNWRPKLLLVERLKRTICLNSGAVGAPGTMIEKCKVTECGSSTSRTKTTSVEQRAQSSLSHDDEGKGSKNKGENKKKTWSLSRVSVKDANKKKKLETFAAVPG